MGGAITRRQVRPTTTAGCTARPGRPLRPGGIGTSWSRSSRRSSRAAPVGAGRRWRGRRRPVLDRSRRWLDGPSPGADRCRYASAQQRSRRCSSLNTSLATERLRPVGGEPLAVLGMEPVADHLVRHHPGMPCVGQAQQTVGTTRGLVSRLHVPRARRCGDRRSPTPRLWTAGSLNWCGPLSTSFASPWTISPVTVSLVVSS
jgi:hypothetical protein